MFIAKVFRILKTVLLQIYYWMSKYLKNSVLRACKVHKWNFLVSELRYCVNYENFSWRRSFFLSQWRTTKEKTIRLQNRFYNISIFFLRGGEWSRMSNQKNTFPGHTALSFGVSLTTERREHAIYKPNCRWQNTADDLRGEIFHTCTNRPSIWSRRNEQ